MKYFHFVFLVLFILIIPIKLNAQAPDEYYKTTKFSGFIRVTQGNKVGIIDTNGNFIFPLKARNIVHIQDNWLGENKQGKWLIRDFNGKYLTKTKFDEVTPFGKGLIKVTKDKKVGLINYKGIEITNYQYDGFTFTPDNDNKFLRIYKKNISNGIIEYTGIIDSNGNVILPFDTTYNNIESYKSGLFIVSKYSTFLEKPKLGFIDTTGKIVLPLIYDAISNDNYGNYVISIQNQMGLANKNGEIIIPPLQEVYINLFDNIYGVYDKKNNTTSFHDSLGKQLIQFENNTFILYKDGYFIFRDITNDNKITILNKNKEKIKHPNYSDWVELPNNIVAFNTFYQFDSFKNSFKQVDFYDFSESNSEKILIKSIDSLNQIYFYYSKYDESNSYIQIIRKNKHGRLDIHGNEITPIIYDKIMHLHITSQTNQNENIFACYKSDSLCYLYDMKRQHCLLKYDYVCSINSPEFIEVLNDNKFGIINCSGKEIIPLIYEKFGNFTSPFPELISAKKDRKWGVIDKYGKIIIPFIYDNNIEIESNLILINENNKQGVLNSKGETILPNIYDGIRIYGREKLITANIKYETYIFDMTGNQITTLNYDSIEPILISLK